MIKFSFVELPAFDLPTEDISSWLSTICVVEDKYEGDINVVFCNDEYLLQLNMLHLNHSYYTDVITFDYSEDKTISGDIFISINRVKENAQDFSATFFNELCRVIVHGVLHLCGYKDKTEEDKLLMRKKEDECLFLYVSRETLG